MHRHGLRQLLRARGRGAGGLLALWQLVRVREWVRASAWKSGLFATKSVSQFTSTITPSFAPARCSRVSQSDARHPAGCSRVSQSDSARWAIRRGKRACVDVRLDDALAGRPARLLVDRRQALGAQSLHGNFSVALRLHQRLLAVHHAGARLIAQGLDRLRVDLDCCAGQGSTRSNANVCWCRLAVCRTLHRQRREARRRHNRARRRHRHHERNSRRRHEAQHFSGRRGAAWI